tara:strand:- start:30 stop:743 length:714 start_codon:yes stop_codon:yes gene_type:complete
MLISDLENEISSLASELDIANTTIADQFNVIQEQLVLISNLESQISEANSSILDIEDQLSNSNELNNSLTSQIAELIFEIDNISSANDSLASPIMIDLLAGWNIIGYTLQNPQDAVATFDGIVDILSVVKNNGGEVYWPEFGYNGIGDLIPGQGYQVRMDEDYEDFVFVNQNGLRIEIEPTVPQWAIDMDVFIHPNDIRTLVRVVNSLGQEVNPNNEFRGTLLYYLYNDGTVEKLVK